MRGMEKEKREKKRKEREEEKKNSNGVDKEQGHKPRECLAGSPSALLAGAWPPSFLMLLPWPRTDRR